MTKKQKYVIEIAKRLLTDNVKAHSIYELYKMPSLAKARIAREIESYNLKEKCINTEYIGNCDFFSVNKLYELVRFENVTSYMLFRFTVSGTKAFTLRRYDGWEHLTEEVTWEYVGEETVWKN